MRNARSGMVQFFSMAVAVVVLVLTGSRAWAAMAVTDSGGVPAKRKITVTSPGVYKVEVWQASGGGLGRFYNLVVDPDGKVNLAGTNYGRGLFEIGWHGRGYKGPDREDCCAKHILQLKSGKPKDGKACYDGCADWPCNGKQELARTRKDPTVMGTLKIIETSPVRVRVQAQAPFTWWPKYVQGRQTTGTYTFYPTGRIVIQVRVRNTGDRPFHWSGEYGPHLFFWGLKKGPNGDPGYLFHVLEAPVKKEGYTRPGASSTLVMASSSKVKTAFMLTIPPELNKLFDRHMKHADRFGYGSNNMVMEPGYDDTWACMIQMGTAGSKLSPELPTPKEALPYAMQYRAPAGLTGVTLVTDDAGDLNRDGYNESEGCHVLKGPGPLKLSYQKGEGAGFAPVFKVTGWKGPAPAAVKLAGKDVPCAAAVVDGTLVLQVLGTVTGDKATIEIGK